MRIRRVIQRTLRGRAGGVDVVGDVNAVVAANLGESGESRVSATSHTPIRQSTSSRAEPRGRTAEAAGHGGEPGE